jgi:hypothetical protein
VQKIRLSAAFNEYLEYEKGFQSMWPESENSDDSLPRFAKSISPKSAGARLRVKVSWAEGESNWIEVNEKRFEQVAGGNDG